MCRKVQQILADINDLRDQIINDQYVSSIHFDIPEQLTREVYVQVIRKVLACVRWEAKKKIEANLKASKKVD